MPSFFGPNDRGYGKVFAKAVKILKGAHVFDETTNIIKSEAHGSITVEALASIVENMECQDSSIQKRKEQANSSARFTP